MTEKTVVDIDKLKNILSELQHLQHTMNGSGGAASYGADLSSIGPGIGPLLDDAGGTISKYVDARTRAITTVNTNANQGIGTVVSLLQTTISNYESNERTHKQAADATGNGGGGSGGSGGSGSGGADGKG